MSHTASQVEHRCQEFGGMENLFFKQTSPVSGCTECKRPIVIVKIVLPVTVVGFNIYVELLELVTGHNEIQFFNEFIIVMKECSEAKLISLLGRNDFDQNFM